MTLPDRLPLFPLADAVLFPDVYLPLHIFEPRYRAMTRDVLEGRKLIGMTVLRDGSQESSSGLPSIYMTGCAGTIVHHEPLKDGRYDIVLFGVSRFQVIGEITSAMPYRVATVRWHEEPDASGDLTSLEPVRQRIEALLLPAMARGEVQMPSTLSDQALINAVCQAVDIPVVEKLALLEKHDVLTRGLALLPILESLVITQAGPGPVH